MFDFRLAGKALFLPAENQTWLMYFSGDGGIGML